MLIIDKQSRRPLLIALAMALLLAGAVHGWHSLHGVAVGGETHANRVASQASGPRMVLPAATSAPVAASVADGRPAFISAEDWASIQNGLREHPKREVELRRIVAYLGFRSNLEQWKAMEGQPDAAARARLSETLLGALPERLLHQEVTGGEALLLQGTLIKTLVKDQASFDARMRIEKARLDQVLASDTEMQAKLRKEEAQASEYQQLAGRVMARYQAKQINEQQMERELEAARVQVFK